MGAQGSDLSLLLKAAGSTRGEEQLAPGLEAAKGFQISAVTPPAPAVAGAEAFPWTSRALHPMDKPSLAEQAMGKAACPAELEFRNSSLPAEPLTQQTLACACFQHGQMKSRR